MVFKSGSFAETDRRESAVKASTSPRVVVTEVLEFKKRELNIPSIQDSFFFIPETFL